MEALRVNSSTAWVIEEILGSRTNLEADRQIEYEVK
jgi:hypothetical protein